MWIWSLGWEDPLEKEMAVLSSILAWKFPGQRSLVGYSPGGRQESDHNSTHAHPDRHPETPPSLSKPGMCVLPALKTARRPHAQLQVESGMETVPIRKRCCKHFTSSQENLSLLYRCFMFTMSLFHFRKLGGESWLHMECIVKFQLQSKFIILIRAFPIENYGKLVPC